MRDIPLLAEEGAKREPDRAKPQERMRRAKRRRRRVVRPADHVIAELTTPALSRHPSSARRGIVHEQHARILNLLRLPDPHDQDHPDLWRSHGRACIPDLDRTEGDGASPDAAWSDTRRTIWASSADCRRPEISFQRRCYPGECQQVSICSCTCRVANSCVAVFFRFPFGPWLQVTDLSVGLLFIFATTSLGVYGIALGGWASNSKYPLMGAMRSSAQMISYELSLTLSVVGVLMIANTLSLNQLVMSQQRTWLGFIPRWNIFLQPVAFLVYLVSAVAETNSLPFDLSESEQELVAGWHTGYSSLKFAMFMLAEYANMVTVTALATIMFFGGWSCSLAGPDWLQAVLPTIWFALYIFVFIFFYVLLRSAFPM